MKTRAAIAKDARRLRSGSNSPLKVEQSPDGEKHLMGKANKQSTSATVSAPAKRAKPDMSPRTRAAVSVGKKLLKPSALDDPSRPACGGTTRRSGRVESPAGSSTVGFDDTMQAAPDGSSQSVAIQVRMEVEEVAESSNAAQKKIASEVETVEGVRDDVATTENSSTDPRPQVAQTDKQDHKSTVLFTGLKDSPSGDRGSDVGREAGAMTSLAKTRLRVSAKMFGAQKRAKREPSSKTVRWEDPEWKSPQGREEEDLPSSQALCRSECKETPATESSSATAHDGSRDSSAQGGAETETTTSLQAECDEAMDKADSAVENNSLHQESKKVPHAKGHDESEMSELPHTDALEGEVCTDEVNSSQLDTEKIVEEAEGSGKSCQIESSSEAGPQPSKCLNEDGCKATPGFLAHSAVVVKEPSMNDGNMLPSSATDEAVTRSGNMEGVSSKASKDEDIKCRPLLKERPIEQSPEGVSHEVREESPRSRAAETRALESAEEREQSTRKNMREEAARSETPLHSSNAGSLGSQIKFRKRSKSERRASAKHKPSRALPKRHCSVQTSLVSFVRKLLQGNVEAAQDSSSSSWYTEEGGSSSDDSTATPSRKPRKKRQKREQAREDHHDTDEEDCPWGMIRRREVATQIVADGTSSNIWFEFYAAEPTVRRKMHKRNHYTQTNARTIAELDYEKCTAEPVVKTKYFCGVESCTYRSTITDLIGHVKVKHVGYKILVCKRCRKKYESLALFVCHLGSKSCPWNESEEEEEVQSASSGGEDSESENDAAGGEAKQREPMQVEIMDRDKSRAINLVSSGRTGPESVVVVLTSTGNFLRAMLPPKDVALSSPKKVARLLKAGTKYTKALFCSGPLLDLLYIHIQPLQLDEVDGPTFMPHALYRTLAPFLAPEWSTRLSSLLQRYRPTKSALRRLLAAWTTLDAKVLETASVVQEPLPPPSLDIETEAICEALLPASAKVEEEPSTGEGAVSDLLQRAVDALSSPPGGVPLSQSADSASGQEAAPTDRQDLWSSTTQASGVSQSGTLSYVIPMVLDGKHRSFTTYVMPTMDVNRMLLPLVAGVAPQPSDPSKPSLPRFPCDTPGKFPKLMPKASSPYEMHTMSQQPVQCRRRCTARKRALLEFPAMPNRWPQPSHRSTLGTVPSGTSMSTVIAHTSGVQKSESAVQSPSNTNVPQADITGTSKVAAVTANLQALRNVVEKGLQSPATVSNPLSLGSSSISATSLQKYKDVFQAALERAVKASEASAKRSVPEVSEQAVRMPGGVLVYLCECAFLCRTKVTLEEHIRKEHIGQSHLCRICSVKFSQLSELERHFLKHVKVAKEDVAPAVAAAAPTVSEKHKSVPSTICRRQPLLDQPYSPDRTSPSLLKDLLEKINPCCVNSGSARAQSPVRDALGQEVILLDSAASESTPRGTPLVQKHQQVTVIDVDSSDSESDLSKAPLKVGRPESSVPLCAMRPDLVGSEAMKPFFKCIIGDCKVTSDDAKEFSIHLTSHPYKDLISLSCIYCKSTFDAIGAMVSHMTQKHGRRVHQCGWCLYRAAAEPLLRVHLRFSHPDKEVLFYRCEHADFAIDDTPPEKPEVTEYRCGVTGCGFRSFGSARLQQHYETEHRGVTQYLCSFCNVVVKSTDALVEHCTIHGLHPLHCTYCCYGTATFPEMLRHLSDMHADGSPNFFIRTPQGQRELRAFADRPDNRALFALDAGAPTQVCRGVASEVRSVVPDETSMKPCPFCSATVRKLSDITSHCSDEHKIVLPISTVLNLLLKKATTEKSREAHLSCPLCNYEGSDCDQLKEHLYTEFGYAPYRCGICDSNFKDIRQTTAHFAIAHPAAEWQPKRNTDFEQWVDNLVDERRRIPEKIRQAFFCVHCEQRFGGMWELRAHLYFHKKYFPQQCTVCAESFTTVEEAEQHQRDQHKMSPPYLVQQVRLAAVEQVIEESLEAQVDAIQERIQNSHAECCLWEECKYHSSERSNLLEHMNSVHIGARHTCASCSFASYCKDVVVWHAKTMHCAADVLESTELVIQSPAPIIPKPRGTFKCCYCKFRGNSSVAIREHAATAHRGLPVKMVAPPRPSADFDSPVKTPVAVGSGAIDTASERTTPRHGEMATPPVRSVGSQPVGNEGRRLRCSRCNFSAPSEKILMIHWSNLHRSGSENDEEGTNASLAVYDVHVSSTTADLFSDLTKPGPSRTVFEHTHLLKPHLPKAFSSGKRVTHCNKNSPFRCASCSVEFDRKSDFIRHLSKRHRFCALCVYCEKAFMNNKQALDHCTKYHPTSTPKFESIVEDGPSPSNVLHTRKRGTSECEREADPEGFSWYNRKQEPIDLEKIYLHAQVPCIGQPMRLTVATFFSVQGRRPELRIKDFTKLL